VHSEKATSLCGVSAFGVIGPYLFEENTSSVTVESLPCFTILGTLLSTKLRMIMSDAIIRFQQDGVRAHTTRKSLKKMKTREAEEKEQEETKKYDGKKERKR
jgi:hypothetical protein